MAKYKIEARYPNGEIYYLPEEEYDTYEEAEDGILEIRSYMIAGAEIYELNGEESDDPDDFDWVIVKVE